MQYLSFRLLIRTVLLLGTLATIQVVSAADDRDLSIKAQPLKTALEEFARHSGLQVIYAAELTTGKHSKGARKNPSNDAMLSELLMGTNLEYEYLNERTVTIRPTLDRKENLSQNRIGAIASSAESLAGYPNQDPFNTGRVLPDANDNLTEEIMVIGSRIGRSSESPEVLAMVTVFDAGAISASGSTNIVDFLRGTPAAGLSNYRSDNAYDSLNNGLNSINLRSLGESRTLVLVDGRRWVSSIPGGSVVDINSIPVHLIKRIEILTGGATAIYGSDAIAGVVNIVLNDEFEGLELRAQFGDSFEGGGATALTSITAGTRLFKNNGHGLINVEYADTEALYSRDRARSAVDSFYIPTTDTLLTPFLSSGGPGGHYFDGTFGIDRQGEVYSPFDPAVDGFNRASETMALIPVERLSINSKLKYRITDATSVFLDTNFVDVNTVGSTSPIFSWTPSVYRDNSLDSNGNPLYFGIPITNPLVPDELRDYALANDLHVVPFVRRATDQDNVSITNDRQTVNFTVGADGVLNKDWNWSAYYAYGKSTQAQIDGGVQNAVHMRYAFDAIEEPGNPGHFVCRDAAARAAGCVPMDIFGYDRVSPEAAEYVAHIATKDGTVELGIFSAMISGHLVNLPAGTVNGVLGLEHRKEKSRVVFDTLTTSGETTAFGLKADATGQFDVSEIFLETHIPLLADAKFMKYVGLDAAARFADYSTIGGTATWKAGLDWKPFSNLRIRAVYSAASRAPNIGELFSPTVSNANSAFAAGIKDPCDGIGTSDTGILADNCRSDAGITAAIERNGIFEYSQSTVQFFGSRQSGNPDLRQELAKTTNIGFTLEPAQLPGLRVAVDYFDIEVDDAISSLSAAAIIDNCLFSDANPEQQNCEQIKRLPSGHITAIDEKLVNQASIRNSGVESKIELATAFGPGTLHLNLLYAHLLKLESRDSMESPVVSSVGQLGGSSLKAGIKKRATASAIYTSGPYSLGWHTTYLGSVKDRLDANYSLNNVSAEIYHDVHLGIQLGENRRYRAIFGIKNVADNDPPLLPSGTFSGLATLATAPMYDVLGRYYYVGISARL